MRAVTEAAKAEGCVLRMACSTLVKASKALAPFGFFEQWETLRAITAGRRSRSARLLVGSTPCSLRKRSRLPRNGGRARSFALPLCGPGLL